MPPPRRTPRAPEARLLRARDLLDVRISAPGCTLTETADGPVLTAGRDASLVLHLPPQHVTERTLPEPVGNPPPPFPKEPALVGHRAAAASRIVFALDDGASVPFTIAGVLTAMRTLALRLAPDARRPAPVRPGRPLRGIDPAPGWERLLTPRGRLRRGVSPADLVRATGDAALEAARLARPAAHVLQRAQTLRSVQAARAAAGLAAGPVRLGDLLPRAPRPRPIPRPSPRPRAPKEDETAIEAPYRVTLSPGEDGAFTHDAEPLVALEDPERAELWRTHLTTRLTDDDGAFVGLDETAERPVRAIWSRDLDPIDRPATTDPHQIQPTSLAPADRRALVRQTTSRTMPKPATPIDARALALSTLGAWLDLAGDWASTDVFDPNDPIEDGVELLAQYRHQATMGRDWYVRVARPGFLFWPGHRCLWVTLSERKIAHLDDPVAALWQRTFIVIKQRERTYSDADDPYRWIAIDPEVTPNLDPAPSPVDDPIVPSRAGEPFLFTLTGIDAGGRPSTLRAPLVFVPDLALQKPNVQALAEAAYAPIGTIPAGGQQITFASSAVSGDTRFEVNTLRFTGTIDVDARTSRPSLVTTNAVVPAMRHLAPQAPGVDLAYAQPYLDAAAAAPAGDPDRGFGAGNPGQVFLSVTGAPPAVDFSGGSDRSGGFLAPSLAVRGLSRSLGAVGDDGTAPAGLSQGEFDPGTFLAGAMPKLFGLFDLVELLEKLGLGGAPEFVTETLDAVSTLVSEASRLRAAAADAGPRLAAEVAGAAHDGARAGVEAARAQLEAVLNPLLVDLDALVDAVENLSAATITDVTDALASIVGRLGPLDDALKAPQIPAALRAALQRPVGALAALGADVALVTKALSDFLDGLLSPDGAVVARLEWKPKIRSWPTTGSPVFRADDPQGLRLAVEVRGSATSPPSVDVVAELTTFALQLLPNAELMAMTFRRVGFRASSGAKPEIDVVFGGMEFLGPLSFVETLRQLIPFDGFADPPFVDVSPEGVTAGFDLALPNVSVGVFSLENLSLGADARVPFLGDAVTVGFHFCRKDSPFRLTVMCIGGGGWLELRASPKGLVVLELGLEATACLSIDLGVASGSVSIAVGVYLRLEGEKGLLTAYFRIRGEVDVLGLISASITLELSLTYHFETGKLIGRASLVVEVEVLFFSASVEITCERKLAGSKGDPTLADVMPPDPVTGENADWSRYCAAFAAV
ncbi:conserved hypothetical protein [Beutenbergia cavernae DSM 12333]|uniref:Uncharacterized protein n=1 Tax=Beutenbergia cavernae (strain ATCC BAA-8 / DSM 12333 / CCUG 43141 / JCM 11478 / NBRC 16432 / NCIMB 13614 / HKI 0122) TaxID=471853 RepID=C5BWG3_BEUC1|nr:hypothetical protein [Beutenbergia cavernae]ACQ78621.1 conserved hypothetical protein [Beutenbergia cavernae DSM 12333]